MQRSKFASGAFEAIFDFATTIVLKFPRFSPKNQEGTALMHHKFEVVVGGSGNAGFGVSFIGQITDKSIAFIEDRELRSDIVIKTNDMIGWLSANPYAGTAACAKFLIDKEADIILGVHLIGHNGEDLVHIFALAMRHEISAINLKVSPAAYLTFASDINNVL